MSGKYALVIGNTEYMDSGLAQLPAPGKDTEDFANVLRDKDICAFDDVKILLNQSNAVVIEAIDELFDQKKPDDLLVLYFAGHGVRDELGSLYLAVKNTVRTRLRSTAIKSDYIREAMDQSRSRRQVLIVDCTNSGSWAQGTKYSGGQSMGTGSAFEGFGRVVIAASDRTQFGWEGDKLIGESKNSLLTPFLIKGLQGEADLNGDGQITVDELYDYAYENIALSSPGQTPGKWASLQQGEIILRYSMRFEDVKSVALPVDLTSAIEDNRPYVREAAVQELGKILKGSNVRMARSAREALERIIGDANTTHRVAQLARQMLEPIRQVEEKPYTREEAEQISPEKVEPKREIKQDDGQRLIQYSNAKIVLVGDTGVGKSGLALVLTNQSFTPTESTHGRRVLRFDNQEIELTNGTKEIRESILWDLAGQPGYRLIHQLDLQDADVALIVFDAQSETNPIPPIMHCIKALEQSEKSRGPDAPRLRKFLVAARVDRGPISMSPEQISAITTKFGIERYYETSAKEGWNIADLAKAIRHAIDWDSMFKVSSNILFERVRNFLNEEKLTGHVLSTLDDLYRAFIHSQKDLEPSDDLRTQFNRCVSRIESLGLVRSLSFGTLVLLQPEILASYASALINTVKGDPEGLGSIAEDNVRNRKFFVPKEEGIQDVGQEKLLLIAMIEDLLKHEIALREGADIVFPTQLTRENPELPDPAEKSIIFEFGGPIQNIYATLVVRLSHSDVFKKKDLWKNAATFTSRTKGTCGLLLHDHGDGHGIMTLFYDNNASEETRFQFEEYVHVHIVRFALSGSVRRERIFICTGCNTVMSNAIVTRRRERGFNWLDCPVCSERVWLLDGEERLGIKRESGIDEIDEFADAGRRREINASILQGKIATKDFDVFLCHNSQDKPAIKELGERLKANGILPWLDEWELRPGLPWQRLLEEQISKIKAAAVFVGSNGIGPWQRNELDAFLRAFVDRGCPVIPVLLPTAPKAPDLPIFLQSMTWVDFRRSDPEPLERLIWGITGERVVL